MINEMFNLYGVSGYEKPLCQYIKERIKPYCSNIWTDSMGNLHAEKNFDENKKTIMLGIYMDEPGVIITKITDDGYLKFETVGRIKEEFLPSTKVNINGKTGAISLKAIHLTTKKEREIPIRAEQLFIDIGADNKEQAKKLVQVGDYGYFLSDAVEFGDDFIKGRALGGRIGCLVAMDILKKDYNCNLHIVFAVQREIACRGMKTALWDKSYDLCIFLEGYKARLWEDGENLPKSKDGAGLVYKSGDIVFEKGILERIIDLAKDNSIPVQKITAEKSGQEIFAEDNGKNNICVCMGLAVKYPETITQIANKKDIESLKLLAEKTIREFGEE